MAGRIVAEVPPGGAVAILLPNTPSSVIAVLACLGAGRCCLVLNADHPIERNTTILREAGAHAVIVAEDHSSQGSPVPEYVPRIVVPNVLEECEESARWHLNLVGPDDPAVVLYTSGSTGRPKGIVLSQATILDRVRKRIVSMHLHRHDRILSLSALGTTAGLIASLATLLCGGNQFIVSLSTAGVGGLLSLIRDERITVLQGVPALLRLLFEAEGARESLATLRVVRTSGERLLRKDLEAWRATLPTICDFGIGYGQTEISVSSWSVPREYGGKEAILPVGYLASGLEFAIVDEDGHRVPDGEVGELLIRSRYVALGEWVNGQCVPGRARRDTVDARARILPTGDLVRLGSDSLLRTVSRRDRQLKVNGQRVEPAEIEDALRNVPGVLDAAIAVRRSGADATLVAFIVPHDPGDSSLLNRVRESVRRALPSYMQPARVLQVERLSLLPGGKIDERALLALETATPRSWREERAFAARSRAQLAVEDAWLRTLDRESLEADTPFDEAGGDSLRLLRFIFHLEQQCGVTLPLEAFYAALRPSAFVQRLDQRFKDLNTTSKDARRPLFLLPGVGKDEPRLVRFRATCAPELRVIPIDYGDWPDWIAPGFEFTAVLTRIVAAIEAEAPDGPIRFAGYSLGGKIAYAVALALLSAGRTIDFLGILDTDISSDEPAPGRWQRFTAAARRGESLSGIASYLSRWLSNAPRPLALWLVLRVCRARLPGDFGFYLHWHIRRRALSHLVKTWWAQIASPLPQLCVPATLFRSMEHRAEAPADLGWRRICPDITTVAVGGDHYTMFDPPNLEPLCASFTASLKQTAVATARS